MIVSGERQFDAPRETVWRVLNDPASMAKTIPGVESFDVHDERRWTANVKIPLGLGGLKMKVDMEKLEEREPEFAKLAVKGNGVGAIMNMETSFTLGDADGGGTSMAKTMPGVESFDVHDERRWTANVKIPLGLGGLKMKVNMEKTDERELEYALMQIKGQGVGAMMNMETRFNLSDAEGGGTAMKWAAVVKLAGPVASMGQRVLQPIVNQQVQHVLGALEQQVNEAQARG